MRLICDLTPHVSDAVSLGTSSLMFSDLFVASGSVINFNNGDMLLTHSSNALTVSGGQLTVTGELEATSLDINGSADISGTLKINSVYTANTDANDLQIGSTNTGNGGLSILTGNSDTGGIFFGDNDNNDAGRIKYVHSSNSLLFDTNRTTALTINSSQNATFAGSVTATSLDINGAADISGALTGVDALTMSGILDITGTTDSSNATGDTGILRCEGGASIAKKLYVGSTITGSADVIAFSDRKLKDNIETLDGKKVLDMRGVSFTRKDTGLPSSGVIAQEIQKVAPELVHDTEGTLGVAYGNLVGYLIEAVKDQQKQIDELKERCSGCSK